MFITKAGSFLLIFILQLFIFIFLLAIVCKKKSLNFTWLALPYYVQLKKKLIMTQKIKNQGIETELEKHNLIHLK